LIDDPHTSSSLRKRFNQRIELATPGRPWSRGRYYRGTADFWDVWVAILDLAGELGVGAAQPHFVWATGMFDGIGDKFGGSEHRVADCLARQV
jgi:hypothetical protein